MVAVESCLYDSVLKSGEPGRIWVSLTIPPNNRASASRPCLSPGLSGLKGRQPVFGFEEDS